MPRKRGTATDCRPAGQLEPLAAQAPGSTTSGEKASAASAAATPAVTEAPAPDSPGSLSDAPHEPLDVEATPLGDLLDDLADDPFAEPLDASQAVYDDDFIRSRRALNAARGGNVAAVLSLDTVPAASVPAPRTTRRACPRPAAPDAEVFSPASGQDTAGFTAPDDGLSEEIMSAHPVWRGAFLTAEDVAVRLPNGRVAQRDVLRHPGGAAVIALTSDGKIVLVHQYRTALEQVTLEIPAGKLDPGEDPAQAAARELLEETGYMASRMAYLGPIAMAPGYSDEIIHLYMAMGLQFAGAHPDDDEFVHVDLVDLDEMVDAVLDGKVTDAKTVVGVLLCDAISRRMEA